jgi:cell division protease FtsH
MTAEERRRTAYHESGHALVGAALGRNEETQRLSVVARGRSAAQAVLSKSWQERVLLTRTELLSELTTLMAGAAAEELIFDEPSTGADGDLERATTFAELIVGRYGMSPNLGKLVFVEPEGGEFLGGESVPRGLTTGPVLTELHQEVRRVIDESEAKAQSLLQRHRALLDEVATQLEVRETLDGAELESMLEPLRPEVNLSVG